MVNKLTSPIKNTQKKSYQIGIDALLLCGFVLQFDLKPQTFVELGMGDGLASCTLALKFPDSQGFGFDISKTALEVANQQALRLNLEHRLFFDHGDAHDHVSIFDLYTRYMGNKLAHMVITNPPYHKKGSGRTSKIVDRSIALHQEEHTLDYFCHCASILLKHHGHFFCIYNPKHITDLIHTLPRFKLGVRHILAIHSQREQPAKWLLVHAQKNAQDDVQILPSLSLYHGKNQLSQEILNFCPWIA